jgi:hypothetical protein
LNHDADLIREEHFDTLAILFPLPPPAWIASMKTAMNDIWASIRADGVNYSMFAAPRTFFEHH